MASFTLTVPDLQAFGPILQIQVAIGRAAEMALQQQSQPIPAPITVTAMLDTGATGSVIQQGLGARLGIQPVGSSLISTPSHHSVACDEYLVRLVLPNSVAWEGTVIEAPLVGQHIQCLIGRDILAHAVLIYVGPGNLITLSF